MLFLLRRDEETDLKGNPESYKERYMMEKDDIKKYMYIMRNLIRILKKQLKMP